VALLLLHFCGCGSVVFHPLALDRSCFADSPAAFADPMDLDPELRKAIAAATGKDIESIEKAAAAKGGGLSRCARLHLTLGTHGRRRRSIEKSNHGHSHHKPRHQSHQTY
jgi:hypothetical protein